jgi:manganese/zinc/iron transport system permease protein
MAAVFGAAAGVAGVIVSHELSKWFQSVPTGPTIVLCATVLVVLSLLFGSKRGLVWQWVQYRHSRPKLSP